MAEASAKNLLKNLEKSGIADQEELRSSLKSLSEKYRGEKVGSEELVAHLIESGIITKWHADKLLAGKYKGFFLDKYKLLGHLGSGGMSSVYLAESKSTGQKRAIKVLPKSKISDKSYLDRFYREGRAAASLNHPNIVRVYDINNVGDTHFLVMEYVKGKDLYETVRDDGPLSIEDAVDALIQCCQGLVHAHDKGMVHRDIKPANLLRTESGSVKILDLGLALFRVEGEESLTVLHNEKVMGTADYLSPEQAVNSHDVDHRADIYSLGCTLYFLVTGRPPFNKGTLAQRIAMHQSKEPDSILESRSDCPQQLINIFEKMVRKKPAERYGNCREVIAALEQFQESPDATDGPLNTPIETTGSEPVAVNAEIEIDAPFSEFAIDPSSGSGSINTGIVKQAPRIKPRKRKSAPVWLIPSLIAFMVITMIAVLLIVSMLSS